MSLPKSYLALVVCLKTNVSVFISWLTEKKGFVPDAVHITNFELVNLVLNESGFAFTVISTWVLNFINKCVFLSYSLSDLGAHSLVYFFPIDQGCERTLVFGIALGNRELNNNNKNCPRAL